MDLRKQIQEYILIEKSMPLKGNSIDLTKKLKNNIEISYSKGSTRNHSALSMDLRKPIQKSVFIQMLSSF